MNSYNNKNHNNSINNNYKKTNSTKSGFDLIVISLVHLVYFLIQKCDKHTAAVQDVSVIPQRIIWLSINHLVLILTAAGKQAAAG